MTLLNAVLKGQLWEAPDKGRAGAATCGLLVRCAVSLLRGSAVSRSCYQGNRDGVMRGANCMDAMNEFKKAEGSRV